MAAGTTGYADVLSDGRGERDRLVEQAEALKPEATALLAALGIGNGWRAVDLGCGPLGILDLLGERVGPTGEVVGIDSIARFVVMADELVRVRGLANVRVVQGDARRSGLPAGTYDLVHERLVLISPEREEIAAAMVDLARPGGLVVAQEVDITTSFCEPANRACDRLLEAFLATARRVGAEPAIGRRLGQLLSTAGVAGVTSEVRARLETPGSPRRNQLAGLVRQARDGMIRAGILEEAELDALLAESAAHHADPATLVFAGLLFQSWGRRPGTAARVPA